MSIAAIAIGRNEGARLKACLASLQGQAAPVIYVDSGSNDGSQAAARAAEAEVVELDMDRPFTAARARNAGLARLRACAPEAVFVQFLDGDCTLDPGWLAAAEAALQAAPNLAIVCGRRREKFPEASLWNRMIDQEWDTPIGPARACGGDALMRIEALEAVAGYRDEMIAGEEPEMCFRLRQLGWEIQRLDVEMTAHDAALSRFSQWWRRTKRAGHAYAEGAALHGLESPERYNMRETGRALFWGLVLPSLALLGGLFLTPWAGLLLLAWPVQLLRLTWQGQGWGMAFFLVLGKFPEMLGVLQYWQARLSGRKRRLIEYK